MQYKMSEMFETKFWGINIVQESKKTERNRKKREETEN